MKQIFSLPSNYFGILILLMLGLSSCFKIPNPFDKDHATVYPDTVVQINSMIPQICEVNISSSDSVSHTTSYWTDKNTGRIIYKMNDEPYLHSRLHGIRFRYNENGDTLEIAHFEKGIRVDSTVYYYPNGNPKHKIFYSDAKDGNIDAEIQFHENGQRKTKMIAYYEGRLNGAVDYFDDTEKNERTETYYYREGELIGVKIYNKRYQELNDRKDALFKSYQADSIRLAENLLANGGGKDVPVFYAGSQKDVMYDVGDPDYWDIMKIDPAFMLKYNNR